MRANNHSWSASAGRMDFRLGEGKPRCARLTPRGAKIKRPSWIMRKRIPSPSHELRATITKGSLSVRGSDRMFVVIVDGSPSIERARAFSRRRRSPPPRQCREFRSTSSLSEHSSGTNASECLGGSGQGTRKILLHGTTCCYSPSVLSSRYQRLPGLTKVGLATFRRTRYI